LGVVAGGDEELGGGVVADAEDAEQAGGGGLDEGAQHGVELFGLGAQVEKSLTEGADRPQRRIAQGVAAAEFERGGLFRQRGRCEAAEATSDRIGGSDAQCRSWLRVVMRSSTAERRATINTRIASTLPVRDFGAPFALPDSAARAAAIASSGSDLPAR
jgi:hypothetical protein